LRGRGHQIQDISGLSKGPRIATLVKPGHDPTEEEHAMRFVIRPVQDPQREIDLTRSLTAAIAEQLWLRYRGNERLNWLEAELHLQRFVESLRGQAKTESIEKARTDERQDHISARSVAPSKCKPAVVHQRKGVKIT